MYNILSMALIIQYWVQWPTPAGRGGKHSLSLRGPNTAIIDGTKARGDCGLEQPDTVLHPGPTRRLDPVHRCPADALRGPVQCRVSWTRCASQIAYYSEVVHYVWNRVSFEMQKGLMDGSETSATAAATGQTDILGIQTYCHKGTAESMVSSASKRRSSVGPLQAREACCCCGQFSSFSVFFPLLCINIILTRYKDKKAK